MSFFATDKDLKKVPIRSGASGGRGPRHGVGLSSSTAGTRGGKTLPPLGTATSLNNTTEIQSQSLSTIENDDATRLSPAVDNVTRPLDIVTTTRLEREQRERVRHQSRHALCIQKHVRSYVSRRRYYRSIQNTLTAQLQDISKVKSLLAKKNVVFVLQPDVARRLFVTFLVLQRHSSTLNHLNDLPLLSQLCECVVMPSCECDDPMKHFVATELRYGIDMSLRVSVSIVRILLTAIYEQRKDLTKLTAFSRALNVMLFDGTRTNPVVLTAIKALRDAFWQSGLLDEMAVMIRKLLPLSLVTTVDDFDTFVSFKQKLMRVSASTVNAVSVFVSLTKRLTDLDVRQRLAFLHKIWTIPCLTIGLQDSLCVDMLMDSFLSTVVLQPLIEESKQSQVLIQELTSVMLDEFHVTRMQIVAINTISLFASSSLDKLSAENKTLSSTLINLLLKYATKFLSILPLIDLISESKAISWTVMGTSVIARQRPRILALQCAVLQERHLFALFWDTAFVSQLASTVVDAIDGMGTARDKSNIASAMSDSSLDHVRKRLSTVHSSWASSSWASKLGLSSLASTWTMPSSASSTSNGFFSWFSRKTSTADKLSSSKNVRKELVYKGKELALLMQLWAALLAPAAVATYTSAPWKALTSLTFSKPVIPLLWFAIHEECKSFEAVCSSFRGKDCDGFTVLPPSMAMIAVLFACLKAFTISLDDIELYEQQKPLPLHQVVSLIRGGNTLLFRLLQYNVELRASSLSTHGNEFDADALAMIEGESSMIKECYSATMKNIQCVLADFHARWARRPFSSVDLWLIADTNTRSFVSELSSNRSRASAMIQWFPWAIDFAQRMQWVRTSLDNERQAIQGTQQQLAMFGSSQSQPTVIRVRRSQILNDGMNALMGLPSGRWKDRIVVRYINELGMEEAGIDVGGLFKDFVTDLSASIFDPNYGLFSQTNEGLLYPNPAAASLYRNNELEDMFLFIGRVLGKAMLENITISPQFTHFFLAFMHGRYNFMNLVDDLYTLDPDLYKNLMFLKNCEEAIVPDLCLTFSVTDSTFGQNKEIDLFPNGSKVNVTGSNRNKYVGLVAKYYLHDRFRVQAGAFFRGLHDLVHGSLIKVFCPAEMQIMISGSVNTIDVQDWKANTEYNGGYTSFDPYIAQFWSVVNEFSEEERSQLLRFVTSVPRPPSLGFSSLNPRFTILRVDMEFEGRLPTASTCFNILKLPKYSNKQILREKLLVSITSKAGFEFS